MKSFMPSELKVFESDSIGFECLIFLNFFIIGAPT